MYKNFKETYKSKKWSAKRSHCLGKCSVDHPAETFLAVSEKYIKFILCSKNPFSIFPHYVPMDAKNAVITTSPENFQKWRKIFRSRRKNVKETYILKKMICIKIPLSLWMQCWSPRRGFPCSLREWHKTFTFFGKSSFCFSSIRSDGHEECSDYNLAEVFSTKGRKCFPESKKQQKKTKNIKKLISMKFLLSR